jgi:hypothetical protein
MQFLTRVWKKWRFSANRQIYTPLPTGRQGNPPKRKGRKLYLEVYDDTKTNNYIDTYSVHCFDTFDF